MSRGKKKNNNAKKAKKSQPKKNGQVVAVRVNVPKSNPKPRRAKASRSILPGSLAQQPSAYDGRVTTKPFMQRSIRLKGCDLLATVSVAAGSDNVSISGTLGSADLNPLLLFPGGRLSQFAELFDKYKYNKIRIVYVPNVGTNTSGALVVAADPDVLDDYNNLEGDYFVQSLTNCIHNMSPPVYQPMALDVKDNKFFKDWLYTDPNTTTIDGARWSSPGKIWWGNSGPLAAASSYGRLYMDWDITFAEPSNDSENSAGAAVIATLSNTFVTSTYPWGDFTSIRNNFALGTNQVFYGRPYVSFYSDPTLGSVIKFNAAGFYHVNIARTGAAMGTGAFTSVTYNNCSLGWPINPTNLSAFNYALSNAGSTASQWSVAIYASQPGAYMAATNDSGVTHSTAYVWVSKLNLVNLPGGGFTSVAQDKLEKRVLALESLLRSTFRPEIGACLTTTSTSTTIEKDPSGGPDKISVTEATGDVENGLDAVNVVTPGDSEYVFIKRKNGGTVKLKIPPEVNSPFPFHE